MVGGTFVVSHRRHTQAEPVGVAHATAGAATAHRLLLGTGQPVTVDHAWSVEGAGGP